MNEKLKLPRRRHRASLEARRARSGYFFVAPFLLGIFLIYLPILIDSVWFSLTTWDMSQTDPITGATTTTYIFNFFQTYKDAFATEVFTTKLVAGLMQLLAEVPAIIVFSLFIAVVLNQKMLGRALFRAIFFIPVIIATGLMDTIKAADSMSDAASGGINDGSGGGANDLISTLDIENLFRSMKIGGELVTYVVDVVNNVYNIINYSGVQMLIFLAGLQSISPSIYEACQIEGATGWETFWKITFPMISPMILVNAVYTVIDSFTRSSSTMMSYLSTVQPYNLRQAESWIFFLIVLLVIGVVAGIASTFIFYQRRD